MANIEIDFEVFKALTARRAHEGVTPNDVLREILGLEETKLGSKSGEITGWYYKGVHFPEGTAFRVTYKGKTYTAAIEDGCWVDSDGQPRNSPSEAAAHVTGTNVNGWRFWEVKRPSDTSWRKLDSVRG